MPLFGFADIKFDRGPTQKRGPLRALQDSEFNRTTLRYPIDVGNYDKSHYIVFYIRQQKSTSFKRTTASENAFASSGGASFQNTGSSNQSSFGSEIQNKINNGLGQINQASGGSLDGITSAIGKVTSGITGQINNLFGGSTSSISGSGQASTQLIDNSIKKITNSNFLNTTTLTTDAIAL